MLLILQSNTDHIAIKSKITRSSSTKFPNNEMLYYLDNDNYLRFRKIYDSNQVINTYQLISRCNSSSHTLIEQSIMYLYFCGNNNIGGSISLAEFRKKFSSYICLRCPLYGHKQPCYLLLLFILFYCVKLTQSVLLRFFQLITQHHTGIFHNNT